MKNGSIEQINLEKAKLSLLREKRSTRWFWPIRMFEGLIAGIVLATLFNFIPDGYFGMLKDKADVAKHESDIRLEELKKLNFETESLRNQVDLKNNELKEKQNEFELQKSEITEVASNNEKIRIELENLKNEVLNENSLNKKVLDIQEINRTLEGKVSSLQRSNNELQAEYKNTSAKWQVTEKELIEKSKKSFISNQSDLIALSFAKNIFADGEYYDGYIYLGEMINKKKLASLRNKFEIDETTAAYALIDLTVFGTSKNGFIFSDCEFYFSSGSKFGSVKYLDASKENISAPNSRDLFIGDLNVSIIAGDLTSQKILNVITTIQKGMHQDTCT